MNLEQQLQLAIQEKQLAIEKWNQSKDVIDRLEDEIKVLRQSSDVVLTQKMQHQYSEAIRLLEDKVSNLQETLKNEKHSQIQKETEMELLRKKNNDLEERCLKLKCKMKKYKTDFMKSKDDYLDIESKLLTAQVANFPHERKDRYIEELEGERAKLLGQVDKLTNDCSELEGALEVCHERIKQLQLYQHETLIFINELIGEKRQFLQKEASTIKEVQRLRNVVQELIVQAEQQVEKESMHLLCDKHRDHVIYVIECISQFQAELSGSNSIKDTETDGNFESVTIEWLDKLCFEKLKNLVNGYKNQLEFLKTKELSLKSEMRSLKEKLNKKGKALCNNEDNSNYYNTNNLNKQMVTRSHDGLIKKAWDLNKVTSIELKKFLESHESFSNRWKSEIADITQKLKTRINVLKTKCKKAREENMKLRNELKNHTCTNITSHI